MIDEYLQAVKKAYGDSRFLKEAKRIYLELKIVLEKQKSLDKTTLTDLNQIKDDEKMLDEKMAELEAKYN